jgi:hypothetical protein
MNKILLTVAIMLFCCIYVVNAQLSTNHKLSTRAAIARTTKNIIEHEKKENKCKLTDAEMKEALGYFFKKKGITLSSFSVAALSSTKIIDGLYMIIKDKKTPQQVYSKLNMVKYDISKEEWTGYTKRYKDIKAVDRLKKGIPNNMDAIIETGKKQFGSKLEDWLLLEKIIMDFNTKYPKDRSFTLVQKEKKWWSVALKKYKLDAETYDNILNHITLAHSLSTKDQKIMKEYFKNQKRETK